MECTWNPESRNTSSIARFSGSTLAEKYSKFCSLPIQSETFQQRRRNASLELVVDGEGYFCSRLRLGEVGSDSDNVMVSDAATSDVA